MARDYLQPDASKTATGAHQESQDSCLRRHDEKQAERASTD